MDKTDLTWKIFLNNQEMIKLSDATLRFVTVITGVLTFCILANLNELLGAHLTRCMLCVCLVAFVAFVMFALWRSLPRFASKTGDSVPKLVDHQHISERAEASNSIDTILKASDDEYLRNIRYQRYEVAGIATAGFRFYSRSWFRPSVQVLSFTVLLILQAF